MGKTPAAGCVSACARITDRESGIWARIRMFVAIVSGDD
jgi:hypothetical protein